MSAPLVVVDLEGPHDAALGAEVVASLHQGIDADRPLVVVGHDVAEAALRAAAGIVVTGSPAMVHDAAWALPLGRRLLDAAADGVPVLGVCFAHQLLAVASGGRIDSWDTVRTGIKEVRFLADAVPDLGPFAGLDAGRFVHTHRDRVVDGGALVPVAAAGADGIPALAHPTLPVWTMQGHPEATSATCRAWGNGLESLDSEGLAATDGPRVLAGFGRLRGRPFAQD